MVAGGAGIVAAWSCARRTQSLARRNWAPPRGRTVTTSTLAARVRGDRGDPVVLLHGLVASGLYWGATYDRLGSDRRLVVPDLLGFGRSPRPPSGYGPDDHVHALVTCLDELGVTEPATIGAHSLGSLIAIRLAATLPDRVANIVVFGPPLYSDPVSALRHVGGTSAMGRLFILPGRTAEVACRWVCEHRDMAACLAVLTHPGLPAAIAADGVQHTWESYSETLERVILTAEPGAWLSEVACPVTVVVGDSDRVVDHDHLSQLAARHPHLSVETWEGLGHDVPLALPQRCLEMIEAARRYGPRG